MRYKTFAKLCLLTVSLAHCPTAFSSSPNNRNRTDDLVITGTAIGSYSNPVISLHPEVPVTEEQRQSAKDFLILARRNGNALPTSQELRSSLRPFLQHLPTMSQEMYLSNLEQLWASTFRPYAHLDSNLTDAESLAFSETLYSLATLTAHSLPLSEDFNNQIIGLAKFLIESEEDQNSIRNIIFSLSHFSLGENERYDSASDQEEEKEQALLRLQSYSKFIREIISSNITSHKKVATLAVIETWTEEFELSAENTADIELLKTALTSQLDNAQYISLLGLVSGWLSDLNEKKIKKDIVELLPFFAKALDNRISEINAAKLSEMEKAQLLAQKQTLDFYDEQEIDFLNKLLAKTRHSKMSVSRLISIAEQINEKAVSEGNHSNPFFLSKLNTFCRMERSRE